MKLLFTLKLLLILLFSINSMALSNSIAADEKGWQSVVFLKIPFLDTDNSEIEGYCNGTLIDSKTLISAAHCFVNSKVLNGAKFHIEIGEYIYVINKPTGLRVRVGYKPIILHDSAAQLQFLPGVNPREARQVPPELDIVVIKLNVPIITPPGFIFAPLWNTTLPQLNTASKLTVISINPTETMSHSNTKQMAVLNNFLQSRNNITSTSTSRVAPGDSGAPVFALINNKTYLIGVVKGTVKTFFSEKDIFVTLQGRLNIQ